jgi:hypothetical protein
MSPFRVTTAATRFKDKARQRSGVRACEEREVVLADETRLRIMKDATGKPKTGFVWTFGAADVHGGFDVAYHFAESRSGATPKASSR